MSRSQNSTSDILLAGAFAALSIDLLVYPLDTIKTRIQSQQYKELYTNPQTGAIQRSLFRGLYQGLGSVVLATAPSAGAFFSTYEGVRSLLHRLNARLTAAHSPALPLPLVNSSASCVAELVSCLILTPAEVLKQNAQVTQQRSSPRSPSAKAPLFDWGATQTALRRFDRPSRLWRGYTVLVGRNLPFTAMHFPAFEHLKASILASRKRQGKATGSFAENTVVTAIASGTAGSAAAVIVTPIDVVKTRIMLDAGAPPSADLEAQAKASKRQNPWAVGRSIYVAEGLKSLFRGGALRAVWTALGSGLYLGAYESARAYLAHQRAVGQPL